MRVNAIALILVISLSTIGCAVFKKKILVTDTEACAVAGIMAAGAECNRTLRDAPRSLTMDEWIDFLEPAFDVTGKPIKGPAICQPSEDYNKIKTLLESACRMLGSRCDFETQQMIQTLGKNMAALQKQATDKKKKLIK